MLKAERDPVGRSQLKSVHHAAGERRHAGPDGRDQLRPATLHPRAARLRSHRQSQPAQASSTRSTLHPAATRLPRSRAERTSVATATRRPHCPWTTAAVIAWPGIAHVGLLDRDMAEDREVEGETVAILTSLSADHLAGKRKHRGQSPDAMTASRTVPRRGSTAARDARRSAPRASLARRRAIAPRSSVRGTFASCLCARMAASTAMRPTSMAAPIVRSGAPGTRRVRMTTVRAAPATRTSRDRHSRAGTPGETRRDGGIGRWLSLPVASMPSESRDRTTNLRPEVAKAKPPVSGDARACSRAGTELDSRPEGGPGRGGRAAVRGERSGNDGRETGRAAGPRGRWTSAWRPSPTRLCLWWC